MSTESQSPALFKPQTAAPVKAAGSKATIRDLLEKQKEQFQLALPKHLTPDRFMRVALTVINKNPKLGICTPPSLLACLMDCAQLGLEPDGRRAHLIPYGDKCTLIVDYKGLVELMMNSGDVSNIHADIVCENDAFDFNKGVIETHRIDFRKPRGAMYAAFCIITMKDGTTKAEVMTKDEIDAIRKRSKASNAGPWVTDFNEMAKKTVFRRASKWIKLSPEIREKLEKDDSGVEFDRPALAPSKPQFDVDLPPSEPVTDTAEEAQAPTGEPPATEKAQPASATSPAEPPPEMTDDAKEKEIKALLKKHEIPEKDALDYLGSIGFSTFAELPDNFVASMKKNPGAFKKAVAK